MSHQESHQAFETIRAEDWDRIIKLITEGITLTSSGIRFAIRGSIELGDLSPALAALLLPVKFREFFVGDGSTTVFNLATAPLSLGEEIFTNGLLQKIADNYSISGTQLIFGTAPSLGDEITVQYQSAQALVPFTLSGFSIDHKNIAHVSPTPTNQDILVYGINKSSSNQEVAKYRPSDFVQIGSSIDVNSGAPDHPAMVENGGYIWAIGASSGTNIISRIDTSTMTSLDVTVIADTGATITSLATDGVLVYAFVKGGTLAPNSVYKIDTAGVSTPLLLTGLTTVGSIDMAINTSGDLFIKFSGNNQVRKYDVNTGNLIAAYQFTDPIRIVPVDEKIYVLEGSNSQMSSISATGTITPIIAFVFTPSDFIFDGFDLWVSSDDELRKVKKDGTILHSLTPETGLTIQDITSGVGSMWTSYSNDTDVSVNITRIFPGIPGL